MTRTLRIRFVALITVLTISNFSLYAQSPEPTPTPALPELPELSAARESGLFTVLNQSQTIDGVTITLDWAYADPWSIRLAYTYSDEDRTNRRGIVLRDAYGNESTFPVRGNSTEGTSSSVVNDWFYLPQELLASLPAPLEAWRWDLTQQVSFFDPFEQRPEYLDLKVLISHQMPLEGTPPPPPPTPTPAPTPQSGATPVISQPPQNLGIQTFEFDVRIKTHPRRIFDTNASVTAEGVTFTVNRVALTPLRTVVDLCYEFEDASPYAGWQILDLDLYYGVDTDGIYEEVDMSNLYFTPYSETCGYIDRGVFYDGQASELTLEIPLMGEAYTLTEADQASMTAHWEGRDADFRLMLDSGLIILHPSAAQSLTSKFAYELGLSQSLEGNWKITIPIPPA